MGRFADYLYRRLAEGLLLFERPCLDEIYVISLYVDFEGGPHQPRVWFYFNTRSYLEEMIQDGLDPSEARWYFALWEQDFIAAIGLPAEECPDLADRQTELLLSEWLQERSLCHTPAEIEAMLQAEDPDPYAHWDEQVRKELLDLIAEVALQLQESGVILAKFGRCLPLLVHEWDYDRWTLEATRRANPDGQALEFEQWLLTEGWCE